MILNVVATPIGNLGDMSPRAREVLEAVTLVLAEDTRSTRKLFSLLGMSTAGKEFLSSHARSSAKSLDAAISRCEQHEHIALVTDAGTPAISDPGALFVQTFRTTYPHATVVPVPGPSAAITALSVSGFPASHFEFLGFAPHKKGRQTLFQKIAATEHVVVLYESPHRILKTLEALAALLGGRPLMVGREMTKKFEEYPRGTAQELLVHYQNNPDKQKGEFVIVIGPSYQAASDFDILAG